MQKRKPSLPVSSPSKPTGHYTENSGLRQRLGPSVNGGTDPQTFMARGRWKGAHPRSRIPLLLVRPHFPGLRNGYRLPGPKLEGGEGVLPGLNRQAPKNNPSG